jgi:hypothetical protein
MFVVLIHCVLNTQDSPSIPRKQNILIETDKLFVWSGKPRPMTQFELTTVDRDSVISIVKWPQDKNDLKIIAAVNATTAQVSHPGFLTFGHDFGRIKLIGHENTKRVTVIAGSLAAESGSCSKVLPAVQTAEISRMAAGERICFFRTSRNSDLDLVG